jgi:hypothetical protein
MNSNDDELLIDSGRDNFMKNSGSDGLLIGEWMDDDL